MSREASHMQRQRPHDGSNSTTTAAAAAASVVATSTSSAIVPPADQPYSLQPLSHLQSSGSIWIDFRCFSPVVRRQWFSAFLRTLLQLAHARHCRQIARVVLLTEEADKFLTVDMRRELQRFDLDQLPIEVLDVSHSRASLTPASLATLSSELVPGDFLLLASSRPHLFVELMEEWRRKNVRVVLAHGIGKAAHWLPPELSKGRLSAQELQTVLNQLNQASSPNPPPIPPALQRSIRDASTLLLSMDLREKPWSDVLAARQEFLLQSCRDVMGVHCVWEQSPWCDWYERCSPACELPSTAVCPHWNSALECSSAPCAHPHICQACGGDDHRLLDCSVNRLPIPLVELDIIPSDATRLLCVQLLRLRTTQEEWFGQGRYDMKTSDLHRSTGGLIHTAAGVVHPLRGSELPPCDATLFVDWQNIHVPLPFLSVFLHSVESFVLERPGVTRIRTTTIVMDKLKQPEIAEAWKKLQVDEGQTQLRLLYVDAMKTQMIDQMILAELHKRCQPAEITEISASASTSSTEPLGYISKQADLVCLVSGDADFSSALSRLVFSGHRLLLVHNHQARHSFRSNRLWEEARDCVDLRGMERYRKVLEERRKEKKREGEANGQHTNDIGMQPSAARTIPKSSVAAAAAVSSSPPKHRFSNSPGNASAFLSGSPPTNASGKLGVQASPFTVRILSPILPSSTGQSAATSVILSPMEHLSPDPAASSHDAVASRAVHSKDATAAPAQPQPSASAVKPCKFFNQQGCLRGAACAFAHICASCSDPDHQASTCPLKPAVEEAAAAAHRCAVCEMNFNSERQMQEHEAGEPHKRKKKRHQAAAAGTKE